MSKPAYMDEAWFELLRQAASRETKAKVAARLGVSGSTVGQVLNGSGLYGTGEASTRRIADLVLHKFGSFECPHLSERFAEPRVISAAECRSYAHRETVPIGSPQALNHWRACSTCPHKPLSAPAQPKEPKPRRKAPAPAPAPKEVTS